MRAKKSVKTYKQAAVNAVILVVILCFFLYLGVQFSRNFSTTVSTQRTQIITDTDYVYLTGYVFKDETLVERTETGIADYTVRDGEKVAVGQTLGSFYPVSDKKASELSELQAQVHALSEQIARLRSGLSSNGTVSDLAHVSTTLNHSYYAYINAVLDGDFSAADKDGELLLDALVDYTVITGRDGAAENIASSLETEKNAILGGLGSSPRTLVNEESCYFYYNTDGYEELFSSSRLEGMTPDMLNALTKAEPVEYDASVVGKKIYHPKWYLAMPTDEATCLSFAEGTVYEVTCTGGSGKTLSMTLERICLDENGDGDAYLLFSSYDLTSASELFRSQNVKILMGSRTGYRIPAESLTHVGGEEGVFILVGNVVEFRRVTVIGRGNGYLLVSTYEKDAEEGSVSEIPYLYVNDMIVTSGNDLYDGKLLD